MAGLYATDGSIRVTVVDGTTYTGLYAVDGSINVVLNTSNLHGAYHPCGALLVATASGLSTYRDGNGSILVQETPYANPEAFHVTVISGSLGNVAPAAPLMSWASTSSDNTPDFTIDLPSGVGDGTDAKAGDVLRIQYSSNAWVSSTDYVIHTLTSADVIADVISATATGPVANGSYVFRARLERAAGNSAWTSDVAVTISTVVPYTGPGDVVASAFAWGGLRAYNAAYAASGTNPAVDLVDSGGANLTTINILTNGFADWSAIAAFIAAHGTPSVKKVYDQTGNARHWTQTVVANMPTLVAGLGNYVFNFVQASNQYWKTGNVFASAQAEPFSVSLVAQSTSATGSGIAGDDGGLFTIDYSIFGVPDKTYTWSGSSNANAAATDNVWHAQENVYNGAAPSSFISVDGTQSTFSATTTIAGAIYFGTDPQNSKAMQGYATEFGIWLAGFTATQASNMSTNKHTAWGF